MKCKHFLAALLAAALMLSLAACGTAPAATGTTSPAATSESAQVAAEADITQNAAFYDAESGFVIKKFTEPFQAYKDAIYPYSDFLDPEVGDYAFTVLRILVRNGGAEEIPVVSYLATLISSSNPSATEETALALAIKKEVLMDGTEQKLETLTTASGKKLWVVRYFQDGKPVLTSGNPTQEDEAAIAAMFEGLDDQLAQVEMVEAKPVAATGKASFQTVDLDGNPVDSSVFANAEYTMVNIWGSFCSPCIGEMEDLMKMDAEMENVQIITILGDATSPDDDTAEDAREIVDILKLTLPVYLINDQINAIFPFNGVFPTSFMVDRDGNPLGTACVGAVGVEAYQAWIQRCINGK